MKKSNEKESERRWARHINFLDIGKYKCLMRKKIPRLSLDTRKEPWVPTKTESRSVENGPGRGEPDENYTEQVEIWVCLWKHEKWSKFQHHQP